MAPVPDFLASYPHRVLIRESRRESLMWWIAERSSGRRIHAAKLMEPDIMAWLSIGPDDLMEVFCEDADDAFTIKMMFG